MRKTRGTGKTPVHESRGLTSAARRLLVVGQQRLHRRAVQRWMRSAVRRGGAWVTEAARRPAPVSMPRRASPATTPTGGPLVDSAASLCAGNKRLSVKRLIAAREQTQIFRSGCARLCSSHHSFTRLLFNYPLLNIARFSREPVIVAIGFP